ncbi:septum formation protein [Paucibacter oligotrophus]|uniref:dTTP/UTP pyrophosphatase n=1 Tax=Roseateles oligotrophus TaxID=1769250 RepID=A0A840LA69_9BURK|nr:Maf family protein [Roseateles oligotrophus]MBB4843665.1 septum formation protein [Roseateles oligotrophus]
MSFDFLYLASQSPRRRQLLEQLGVRHELLLPGPEEDAEGLEAVWADELPEHYVARVTQAKLGAALSRLKARGLSPAPVLCSDTTVALGRLILGKPLDAEDAFQTLSRLAGRSHRVITAVVVATPDGQSEAALNVSSVDFAAVDAEQLRRYVASGEPFGKAGSYAIQSQAAAWISRIEGSYSGIMGLPLFETAQLLRKIGLRF